MEAMGRTQEEIADVRRLSYRREASKQADKLSLLVGDELNTTLPKEGNVASCCCGRLLHRRVSAMDVGAVKAPTIRRSQACKRSRLSVWISRSRSFRFTVLMRKGMSFSAVS